MGSSPLVWLHMKHLTSLPSAHSELLMLCRLSDACKVLLYLWDACGVHSIFWREGQPSQQPLDLCLASPIGSFTHRVFIFWWKTNSMQFLFVSLEIQRERELNSDDDHLPHRQHLESKLSSCCFCSECTNIKTPLEDDELNSMFLPSTLGWHLLCARTVG